MKYLLCASSIVLMLSLVGCGGNSDDLAGKINNVIDSVETDGIDGANGTRSTVPNGINTQGTTGETGIYGNNTNYSNRINNAITSGDKAIDGDTDSRGYNNINGSSNYEGNNLDSPYGFGMPGAENIIGNKKR